ncbi:MAG: metalloregulator ArsR/SmtB family transcription factor [Alphaproteobacteria bacterium]|nr:metalloregulator ArsR/SmtB family transcription factor [Alphaproteobacteria bacterium]MBU1552004.1 metalloregulator ArsR/SmtB family transcription factor [Alphaproteobacteria bacterium]MBU2337551.1 metalloregulator ArsR/SmtB family transcription factor [Alphaproteobacteria bacterium]MBU2388192.1 metalloregulator ArsR/SmtB family transcription factor [Alphaproteobacteria bacterium]
MSSDTELIERVESANLALRAKLFRGLADASRLLILDTLRTGPRSVGEIVRVTGLSQSNASNHLRCLSECRIVTGVQRGRFIHYHLSDRRLSEVLTLADELLRDTACGVDACENFRGEPKS